MASLPPVPHTFLTLLVYTLTAILLHRHAWRKTGNICTFLQLINTSACDFLMHLSAVKLLPLLCAYFLFTLHFTPHPPHRISFLSASSIWFFFFPLSILTLRFFRLTQLSQLSVFLLHAVSFLTLSVYPVKIRFPSWPEYAPIPISAQFIHCTFHLVLVSQGFFLNLHFSPQFLSMLFPIYPLSGTICQSWFTVRILSAISLSLFYISVAYKTSDLFNQPCFFQSHFNFRLRLTQLHVSSPEHFQSHLTALIYYLSKKIKNFLLGAIAFRTEL